MLLREDEMSFLKSCDINILLIRKEEIMKNKEEITRLLIVVDMINGFVKEGKLSDSYINHITPRIVSLIERFIRSEDGIMFACDSHSENCNEFKSFPVHCVSGSYESDIIDELKPYVKYGVVYKKNSTNMMYAPSFIKDIDSLSNLNEVIISGCCSDICILNLAISMKTYFDQNDRDVIVRVPSNMIETYNFLEHDRREYNDMALKLMRQCGIKTGVM